MLLWTATAGTNLLWRCVQESPQRDCYAHRLTRSLVVGLWSSATRRTSSTGVPTSTFNGVNTSAVSTFILRRATLKDILRFISSTGLYIQSVRPPCCLTYPLTSQGWKTKLQLRGRRQYHDHRLALRCLIRTPASRADHLLPAHRPRYRRRHTIHVAGVCTQETLASIRRLPQDTQSCSLWCGASRVLKSRKARRSGEARPGRAHPSSR